MLAGEVAAHLHGHHLKMATKLCLPNTPSAVRASQKAPLPGSVYDNGPAAGSSWNLWIREHAGRRHAASALIRPGKRLPPADGVRRRLTKPLGNYDGLRLSSRRAGGAAPWLRGAVGPLSPRPRLSPACGCQSVGLSPDGTQRTCMGPPHRLAPAATRGTPRRVVTASGGRAWANEAVRPGPSLLPRDPALAIEVVLDGLARADSAAELIDDPPHDGIGTLDGP